MILITLIAGSIIGSAFVLSLCQAAQEPVNPCAWCDKERGIKRQPGCSHGICAKHADEMRKAIR